MTQSIAKVLPPNPENVPDDGKLKSEMMIKDNRRYYLDFLFHAWRVFAFVIGDNSARCAVVALQANCDKLATDVVAQPRAMCGV